jgi:hypothetical protein
LAPLVPLGDFRHFPSDEMPKAAKPESGTLREDFGERAAILEYDGGFNRVDAEAQAANEFPELPAFLDRRARP